MAVFSDFFVQSEAPKKEVLIIFVIIITNPQFEHIGLHKWPSKAKKYLIE